MHDNGVTLQKKVLQNLDIPYSYELAKRMEQYRSHPTLGYRPAGSKAEFETGEMPVSYTHLRAHDMRRSRMPSSA